MKKDIILVDRNDKIIGYDEKYPPHKNPAKLHRAFSIFLFNDKGQMLIHKRSKYKKTWPGYWTNACCSHPAKGESYAKALQRRLKEELGIRCKLKFLFKFIYKAKYNKTWGEHEIDYVFVGRYNKKIKPNKKEIADWKYMDVDSLLKDVKKNPERYTPWFKKALPRVIKYIKKNQDF